MTTFFLFVVRLSFILYDIEVFTNLCAEGEVITQVLDVILQEEHQSLVEGVVLALHVRILDSHTQNMLIEGSGKVALQQLVVIDGLGNDAADKLEVAEVVGVAV